MIVEIIIHDVVYCTFIHCMCVYLSTFFLGLTDAFDVQAGRVDLVVHRVTASCRCTFCRLTLNFHCLDIFVL